MTDKKHIAILGSTGSIGTQCLDVIRHHKDKFVAEVLVAGNNEQLLIEQALEFQPNIVVIANEDKYQVVADALQSEDIKVFAGESSIDHVVQISSVNMVLTAMVGFAGLKPTLKAIEAGKPIALANKETLVVAGDLIMKAVQKYRVPIIPVDSEHSALFQCLNGEPMQSIKKLILTASGGPFRNKTAEELKKVSLKQALDHPNWDMGPKVTIDSASLMNKGFEIIEAFWLFGIPADKIEVVVHPQSIVHSMVEFVDGSIKAQLGNTDMRLPIQYALSWPNRIETHVEPISLTEIGKLEFDAPDTRRFPNLRLAFEALKKGGNTACVLNAANEIAVQAFLDEKIRFTDIATINEQVMNAVKFHKSSTIENYIESDKTARKKAVEQINKLKL
ncbi:MAG: 1-deoxy-D-xylulose-5-phosphate reductoisomerase [Bacteroidota bacterium]|nr:1-deoxy-D-xylulose-5-phosphate reductoisomerase [Bacteroidota bacterium]